MEDKLVGFEVAKLAKSIGFDWEVRKYFTFDEERESDIYHNHNEADFKTSRPTQTILQKYLREVHEIYVLPFIQFENPVEGYEIKEIDYIYYIFNLKEMRDKRIDVLPYIGEGVGSFVTYNYKSIEDAFEEGLKEAIEQLIENH
jgi:hypothetical protein